MITEIYDGLRRRKLIGADECPPWNLLFSRQTNIDIFPRSGEIFHVKVGNRMLLQHEYKALQEAYSALPMHVAEPLALLSGNTIEYLVCRGIAHINARSSTFHKNHPTLHNALNDYFAKAAEKFKVEEPASSHTERLADRLEQYVDSHKAGFRRYSQIIDRHPSEIDSLPHIKQHGDFAPTNFGISKQGIIIFDWEEFGKEEIPGYDLCVLIISSLDFDLSKICRFLSGNTNSPLFPIVRNFCAIYGIAPEFFRGLLVLCAMLFLYSKEKAQYRSEAIERVRSLIEEMCN